MQEQIFHTPSRYDNKPVTYNSYNDQNHQNQIQNSINNENYYNKVYQKCKQELKLQELFKNQLLNQNQQKSQFPSTFLLEEFFNNENYQNYEFQNDNQNLKNIKNEALISVNQHYNNSPQQQYQQQLSPPQSHSFNLKNSIVNFNQNRKHRIANSLQFSSALQRIVIRNTEKKKLQLFSTPQKLPCFEKEFNHNSEIKQQVEKIDFMLLKSQKISRPKNKQQRPASQIRQSKKQIFPINDNNKSVVHTSNDNKQFRQAFTPDYQSQNSSQIKNTPKKNQSHKCIQNNQKNNKGTILDLQNNITNDLDDTNITLLTQMTAKTNKQYETPKSYNKKIVLETQKDPDQENNLLGIQKQIEGEVKSPKTDQNINNYVYLNNSNINNNINNKDYSIQLEISNLMNKNILMQNQYFKNVNKNRDESLKQERSREKEKRKINNINSHKKNISQHDEDYKNFLEQHSEQIVQENKKQIMKKVQNFNLLRNRNSQNRNITRILMKQGILVQKNNFLEQNNLQIQINSISKQRIPSLNPHQDSQRQHKFEKSTEQQTSKQYQVMSLDSPSVILTNYYNEKYQNKLNDNLQQTVIQKNRGIGMEHEEITKKRSVINFKNKIKEQDSDINSNNNLDKLQNFQNNDDHHNNVQIASERSNFSNNHHSLQKMNDN